MKLSQEDIADIASADIPAEDVAMLEDGSGGDDKGANEKPAAAGPHKQRSLQKRLAPVIDPEPAASGKRSDILAAVTVKCQASPVIAEFQ